MTVYAEPSQPLLDLLKAHAAGFKRFSFVKDFNSRTAENVRALPRYLGAIWYLGLSLGVILATAAGHAIDPTMFARFIGQTSPTVVALCVSALGALLLSELVARHNFSIAGPRVGRGVVRSMSLAALFGIVIVVVDLAIVHPADMNVPFPQSLLFYPVIGFMVETLFHVLPLYLLLTGLPVLTGQRRSEAITWVSLILVAFLEPAFQTWSAASGAPVVGGPHRYAWRALVYDGLHILAINVCQLAMFKQYDFVSMYVLRLVYYGIWHIAWGQARLALLF
jgi:hypothetical protein